MHEGRPGELSRVHKTGSGIPCNTWKFQRCLAVMVLQSSARPNSPSSNWQRLADRVKHEFQIVYYPKQSTPRIIATHITRGATDPIALDAGVETELALSPIGTPVVFVLNGHDGLTTEPDNWTKYSWKNPHLTIYIAMRMPTEDIQNPPVPVILRHAKRTRKRRIAHLQHNFC